MNLPRKPRFEFDSGPTVFVPSIPQRHWTPIEQEIGSAEISATGIGASYIVREDYLLETIVRYLDDEWPSLSAMIRYAKRWPNTVTLFPDSDDLSTFFEMQLWTPRAGESEVRGTRDREYDEAWEITLVWRRIDGLPWDIAYQPTGG
jgi:hypothetical protein